MSGCITADYKDILVDMLTAEAIPRLSIRDVVSTIPVCEQAKATSCESGAEVEKAKRSAPTLWLNPEDGSPIKPHYFDEDGKESDFTSVSALVKARGLPMSGIQCDLEGKKCKATSAVEILAVHGYVVRDDGNTPVKGVSKKLNVYHPSAPQLKAIAH